MIVCDFCGKDQHKVEYMVHAGGGSAMCSECVELSVGIIREARERKDPGGSAFKVEKGDVHA